MIALPERGRGAEAFAADGAQMRLLSKVNRFYMNPDGFLVREFFAANFARLRTIAHACKLNVLFEAAFILDLFTADITSPNILIFPGIKKKL